MSALRVAIAGLGTVGTGVVEIINEQQTLLRNRTGKDIEIVGVSARSKTKDRGIDISNMRWFDEPLDMASDEEVDLVLELVGGSEGLAKELCLKALSHGKHVVTANKALIAHHGAELAKLADAHGVVLAYEAAVAGGIPVIKALREGLAANEVVRVQGIMNGTCNYMLTEMEATGQDFDTILAEAQRLGYAEADPTFDVDGIDTAHKLAILASLSFGTHVYYGDDLHVEGIRNVTPQDISIAREMGFAIKLLGVAVKQGKDIAQHVYPALVPQGHPLASVNNVDNAVFIEGSYVGNIMLQGPGAGKGATASAVMSDVVDVARGTHIEPFGIKTDDATSPSFATIDGFEGSYYVRMQVDDKPGVLAEITDIFAQSSISFDRVRQRPSDSSGDDSASITVVTHQTNEKNMIKTMEKINNLASVLAQPTLIRVES